MFLLQLFIRLTDGLWRLRRLAISGPPGVRQVAAVLYDMYLDGRGSYIPLGAKFAGAPVFPHGPSGIMISGEAELGEDAVIYQQVTIGSNTIAGSAGFGFPKIGRSCYLGAGAKVIGGITVGDNVRIGANAVVTKDVPSNTVVVGINDFRPRKTLDNRFFRKDYATGRWVFYARGAWHRAEMDDPSARTQPAS